MGREEAPQLVESLPAIVMAQFEQARQVTDHLFAEGRALGRLGYSARQIEILKRIYRKVQTAPPQLIERNFTGSFSQYAVKFSTPDGDFIYDLAKNRDVLVGSAVDRKHITDGEPGLFALTNNVHLYLLETDGHPLSAEQLKQRIIRDSLTATNSSMLAGTSAQYHGEDTVLFTFNESSVGGSQTETYQRVLLQPGIEVWGLWAPLQRP